MVDKKKIKKVGTSKKFSNNSGKIVIGTVNKHSCNAAYIRLETWMTPTESLETSIKVIRRRFLANMYKISNLYFDSLKSTLIDYDYSTTTLSDKPGRKSFVAIEITILAKDKFKWNKDFIFSCQNFGDSLFTLLETLSEHFDIHISKK